MHEDGAAMNDVLRKVARDFGTPCFVYFADQMRERVERVRSAFGNRFHISYAVKSNPNPGILRRLRGVVDTLDVSSAGEVRSAIACGWEPAKLGFTGPGKTQDELQTAVDVGVGEVIVESLDETEALSRLAGQARKRQNVVVRISPRLVPRGFGVNMSGKWTQFGIDEEDLDPALRTIQRLPHLDLCGFHIYSGTQCLKAEAIAENYEIFIDVFKRVCQAHAVKPRRLIFGSGLGIPYYENDSAVDLAAVAAKANVAVDAFKADRVFSSTQLVLETGRYVVGEAGVFVMRVIRKKHSRGIDIGICDGGMHHHLAASGHLGAVVQRNYQMFKIAEGQDLGPEHVYNLVGPLCTTIDTLGRQVKFRGLEPGDLIGIRNSGAYGLTASPMHFISHPPPKEIVVETVQGRLRVEDCSQFTIHGAAAPVQ
ncbi:MAG: type III PLP-dependent enzyme [Candidatus Binatia bacterium]